MVDQGRVEQNGREGWRRGVMGGGGSDYCHAPLPIYCIRKYTLGIDNILCLNILITLVE